MVHNFKHSIPYTHNLTGTSFCVWEGAMNQSYDTSKNVIFKRERARCVNLRSQTLVASDHLPW